MKYFKEFALVLLVVVAVASSVSGDRNKKPYKVVCYLGSWANYRKGDGKFLIEHIDPNLCTHIIYGFAKLAGNKIAVYDKYLDITKNWGLSAFDRFNKLKQANPQLSTLIAIGGWNEGSTKYSAMAKSPEARKVFVQSVIDFCLEYGFDGLDFDWEYPANRGGVPEDKQNFVTLLRELKTAFQPHGLLLTAAVSAGQKTIDTAYDIPQVAKYLDFINVMAYDLHGSWEKQTGHNAPLHERDGEPDEDKILNVHYAIQYWIKKGADRKKIVLGMALYGRSFTLFDPANNGLGAPTSGPGSGGKMTKEPGMLGYNEICLDIKNGGWTEVFVPKVDAPYAYNGKQWVGFDNKRSIGIKVDYLIKERLGGGMVWSLETDDFRGKCFGERYPLLKLIATKLNGPVVRSTAPPPLVTPEPGKAQKCTANGHLKNLQDCSRFTYCAYQEQYTYSRHSYSCGEGLAFDEHTFSCTERSKVPGCKQ